MFGNVLIKHHASPIAQKNNTILSQWYVEYMKKWDGDYAIHAKLIAQYPVNIAKIYRTGVKRKDLSEFNNLSLHEDVRNILKRILDDKVKKTAKTTPLDPSVVD